MSEGGHDSGHGGGGGNNGHHGGGFLGPWEHTIESILGHNTNAAYGVAAVDAANRASGASRVARAFGPFADIVGSPTARELFWAGSEVAEHGGGLLRGASKALGPISSVLGGVQMVGNGLLAANDISRDGWEDGHGGGAYHNQEFYNHVGGAALGGAHAVLPWLGPYGAAADLALTGVEFGLNKGGEASQWAFGRDAGFSAESVAGGLIRGTMGDQSWGDSVRHGITDTFGDGAVASTLGWGAQVATNAATLPLQLGATVGRGLYNYGSTVWNSIANGEGAVGGALNHAGHWVADRASDAWDWTSNTASRVGHGIADTASSAWHGATDLADRAWTGATNTASRVGHGIANTASRAWHGATDAASRVGHGIADTATNVWHGATDLASSVGTGISNTASRAWNGATDLASSAGSAVSGAASSAWNAVSDW